ncbi:Phosphatidylglycerol/phosphatidylinositol transfer protein [Zea mays]|uniref:Phosphatidylglycerol/phosphatidylinositol transfer protein n=1 Tax=Zea mays TaxID=4577 RepID=A0A3L6E293_MAIZE|nr:Phosphatidylglycerol/phosphatidylinositol transfer protein [Zea mays]
MVSKQTRRLLVLAAVAVCLHLPAASVATDVDYCSKKEYPVKVSGVQIVPDPVEPGKPATFKISASTDKTIEKGKLVIDVKYFFFYVHSETRDICGEISCPATGDFVLSHEQTLPGFTPPGSYTIYMKMVGDDDEELSCISFGFSIGFVASS